MWSLAFAIFLAGKWLTWQRACRRGPSPSFARSLGYLLALAWQRAGIHAQPLMRAPLLATSLADFWSTRWNTAFNTLAVEFAFRPLARRWGAAWATFSVFLISGLVHEAVISLPARGGF